MTDVDAVKDTVEGKVTSLNTARGVFVAAWQDGKKPAFIVSFDSSGGSHVPDQYILPNEKAIKPEDVVRYTNRELYDVILAADEAGGNMPAGGYNGTSIALLSWEKPGGGSWDFNVDTVTANMTLTATWSTTPVPYNTGLTYAQAISTGAANPIVYVIRDNISTNGMNDLAGNVNVIFLGLGGQRTISLSNAVTLFNLRGNSTVTLGKNIRLTASRTNNGTSFIILTQNSNLTMLDGSEISDIRSNVEGGVVMTIGVHARYPQVSPATTATFVMEGGEITRNETGTIKYTWVSIIMVYDGGGKVILNGGKIWGNNHRPHQGRTIAAYAGMVPWTIPKGHIGTQGGHTGTQPRTGRVAAGDICLDQGIGQGIPFEISGTAEVEFIYIGNQRNGPSARRPYYFLVGPNWTGKIDSFIMCMGTHGWVGGPFIGPTPGHTLVASDIDNIQNLMWYEWIHDPENGGFPTHDMEPRTDRLISNGLTGTNPLFNGANIGYLLEYYPEN